MDIKCIIIDYDGTLSFENSSLNLDAAHAIQKAQKLKLEIVFASGRSSIEMFSLATFLGTKRVSIGENGGVIQNGPNNFRLLGDIKDPLIAYDKLSKKIKNVTLMNTIPRFTEIVLERTFEINEGIEYIKQDKIPVELIDSQFSYHLQNNYVNKGKALEKVQKILGINKENCVGIGDSITDIPLFEQCEYSISVNNALDEVKNKTDRVTKSERGYGAKEAIEYILKELY